MRDLRVADLQREGEVFEGGQARQKALFLVDKCHIATDPAESSPPPPVQASTFNPDFSAVRSELPMDKAQECRLAGSARPGDLD